ncbi:hypothetical protein [Maribacter litoralis]|uniref:hypothetical protein n=1 Tax=Maribacter litoralis TaxID=2059726 RepID=UPI003D2D9FC6
MVVGCWLLVVGKNKIQVQVQNSSSSSKMLLAFGFWLLAFGFWLLAFGFWLLAFGYNASRFLVLSNGYKVLRYYISNFPNSSFY